MNEETKSFSSGSKEDASRRARVQRKRSIARWVKRGVFTTIAILTLVGIGVSLIPEPLRVETATVATGPMRVTVNEDGKTSATNRYVLSAPLTGNMNRIRLKAGDMVNEGQPILRIVPAASPLLDKRAKANAEARLGAANAGMQLAGADVARATSGLEQAKREASRVSALVETGVASQSNVESAEFTVRNRTEELRAARFSAKVRKQDEESARAALGLYSGGTSTDDGLDISAPVSGNVLRVLREDQEGPVAAGAPLLEIADLGALEIVADILTADAVHIHAGAKTRIVRWGGDSELLGHVRRVEPSAFTRISALGVEEQRVLVIIDLDSPRSSWQSLGDGYRVEVEISIWEHEAVRTAPASSVFRHEGSWAVYEVVDGVAHRISIEIGHRNDRRVEIVSGLGEGARVIVHPSDRVEDGIEIVSSE